MNVIGRNYNIRVGKTMLIIGLYICLMFSVSPVLAQSGVSKDMDSIGSIYNMRYEMPKRFNDLNTVQAWVLGNTNIMHGGVYWVFESKDKECKVLYRLWPSEASEKDYQIDTYLGLIYGTGDALREKYLITLSQKDAQRHFNADSVYLYHVPTAEPKKHDEKFIDCIQMLIFKQSRSVVELVWYFTEKGRTNKKRYMKQISKRIWFNDGKAENYIQMRQEGEDWLRRYLKEHPIDRSGL